MVILDFPDGVMRRLYGYLTGARCRLFSMVQLMPLHPKPHHLLPHLNPDWFYLSAFPGCPGKEAVKRV